MSQSHSASSPVLGPAALPGNLVSAEVRNSRSRNRFEAIDRPPLATRDEALIVDERAELRPAQVVESKLTRMLENASVPVSHLQMRGILRQR